jgi:hypothetical protein
MRRDGFSRGNEKKTCNAKREPYSSRMSNNTTNQIVLMTRSETLVTKIFPTMNQTMDQAVQAFCAQQEIELLQWFYDWNNS